MSMETELKTYLRAHAGLVALVGARTYPGKAPQQVEKPYCVYRKSGNERMYSHQGNSGLDKAQIEVNCYAETYLQAKAVADQVTAAMEAWPGANSKVQSAFQVDEQDLTFEDDAELHHILVDFVVMYG